MHGFVAERSYGSEPVLPITVVDVSGSTSETQAVVDTGFSGELTLPLEMIRRLGYSYAGTAGGTLADGSESQMDYYEGRARWHGEHREVVVIAAEGEPLIGMDLLVGSRLEAEVIPGGKVLIEEIDGRR